MDIRVHQVRTAPTASLVQRAARLRDTLADIEDDGPVHLVGHSTGGLDARILCTPGVRLPGGRVAAQADRVRTVTPLATPHRGTPIARLFQGVRGRRLLRALSAASLVTLRTGKRPVRAVLRLAGVVRGLAENTVGSPDLVDELFSSLLDGFDDGRRDEVRQFLEEVGRDTSLVGQLPPEATEPLTALAPDRPGIRYQSIITRSPAPRITDSVQAGPRVGRQAALALYAALYRATARPGVPLRLSGDAEEGLRLAFGALPEKGANDAIVPTRSQPWGRVLLGVEADHLDILGHYAGREARPPHYDWLPSGAGFGPEDFARTWDTLLDAVLQA